MADNFADMDTSKGISLIYVEHIREASLNAGGLTINNDHFKIPLRRVVAHEICHNPLSTGNGGDHGEGGIMDPFNFEIAGEDPVFTPKSLKRIRNANTWRD